VLQLGEECVVFGSKAPPPEFTSNEWARRRIMFTDPTANSCRGSGSVVSNFDEITTGLYFTCTVTSSNSCTNTTCIRGEDINEDENAEHVFDAMQNRLRDGDAQSDCAKPPEESPAQSFQNAFGNGDGDSDWAPDPPALGGTGVPNHVYVQNDCFGNPRIVVLPILSSSNRNANSEPVRGFALVYITGCYHEDAGSAIAQMERNECAPPPSGNDSCEEDDVTICWDIDDCEDEDEEEDCHYEIRGIPIHAFITEGSLGEIGEPSNNAPLTIQTVK
jgi:hypothetical protein